MKNDVLIPAPRSNVRGVRAWPLPLCAGDRIGVVAPGFAVRPRVVRAGIERLEALGYGIVQGKSLFARDGYFAGDDRARAADVNRMLRDTRIRCVWFARGGYGTARILARIDWDALRENPKLLIGYSDLTALFARAAGNGLAPCVYGPVVAELADPAAFHAPSLAHALAGRAVEIPFAAGRVLRHGRASGRLLGGNLTVLIHLLGTPFAPDLDGAVLVLEDAGEEAYRIDRLLSHLVLSGALDRVAGIALGRFVVPPRKRAFPPDRPLAAVLRDRLAPLGIPIATGLPFGHVAGKRSLPLGGMAHLDTRRANLVIEAASKFAAHP